MFQAVGKPASLDFPKINGRKMSPLRQLYRKRVAEMNSAARRNMPPVKKAIVAYLTISTS
jgi:hypothetical protein